VPENKHNNDLTENYYYYFMQCKQIAMLISDWQFTRKEKDRIRLDAAAD